MSKPARKKRPPERSCPRGAKDNSLIRERLDAVRPGGVHQVIDRSIAAIVSERLASIHADYSLRGPQKANRFASQCRPIHVDCSSS